MKTPHTLLFFLAINIVSCKCINVFYFAQKNLVHYELNFSLGPLNFEEPKNTSRRYIFGRIFYDGKTREEASEEVIEFGGIKEDKRTQEKHSYVYEF